jgi:transporter family-2 protein
VLVNPDGILMKAESLARRLDVSEPGPVWRVRFLPLPSPLSIPKQSGVRDGQAGAGHQLMIALALLGALLAGALITIQTGSNTRLKEALGHPLPAIVVSSLVGVVLLAVVTVAARVPLPSLDRVAGAPWTAWIGGLLGAAYAVTVVILARGLGAATLTALVVSGQLICSVVLDHYGLLGFEVRMIGIGRLAGCALLLAGTFLIWKF